MQYKIFQSYIYVMLRQKRRQNQQEKRETKLQIVKNLIFSYWTLHFDSTQNTKKRKTEIITPLYLTFLYFEVKIINEELMDFTLYLNNPKKLFA